jgi:ankyrin repeat protein
MDDVQHSFDHFGLHRAALAGDDEGVYRALDMGADINGLDKAGRTAVMCAVAGNQFVSLLYFMRTANSSSHDSWQNIDASFLTAKRLNTIQLLLRHPDISLFTLNAPQSSMNGVIPLGMAAWLNMPDVVRLLLEDSAHTVSVDGMDSHGATALMCKSLLQIHIPVPDLF